MKHINVGGLHFNENRSQLLPYLFLSEDEIKVFEELLRDGYEFECQDVPTNSKYSLAKVLEETLSMDLQTSSLPLSTKGFNDIIDITGGLQNILSESDFIEGSMLVFVSGSTAGLTTIEFESGLERDIKEFFEEWIPMNRRYHHNERWHDGNGYAHVRAAMLKPSLIIPFTNSNLCPRYLAASHFGRFR